MKKLLLTTAYFAPVSYYAAIAQHPGGVVLEVCDNFQKQTYRNRCYIYGANGRLSLNAPVEHPGTLQGRQRTSEVTPCRIYPWQAQHWKSIQTAYRTSPYFEYYEDIFAPLFSEPAENLLGFNRRAHAVICKCLALNDFSEMTSEYMMQYDPQQVIDLREGFPAKKQGETDLPAYTQVFSDKSGFLPNLSVLDLIFCLGREAPEYLREIKTNFT